MEAVDVQQITGIARSVSQLLSNSRYGLDYYQREYSWEEQQVGELIDDLAARFLDEFVPTNERSEVAGYRPYFLGPIVTAQRGGVRFLVDGQQRITTLTLILIHLRGLLQQDDKTVPDADALGPLIFSTSFGKKAFNLDVDERNECLNAILDGRSYDPSSQPESVRNLWRQHLSIADRFPDDLQGHALAYFSDWLQHRVVLVDIAAPDQDMALEIFETMNDRGLRLSNTDMLKSYLLARAGDADVIRSLNDRWRQRVTALTDVENNADAEFVKAWLRGKYAKTQRERKANATPGDFDMIGTAFHKWVRDNPELLDLGGTASYQAIVEREFFGLSSRYLQLLDASQHLRPGFEAVFYNSRTGLTLQLPVIMSAVTATDDDMTFQAKTALIASALDIFVARRMVNLRNFGYSTVVYTMFNLIKQLRNKSVDAVRSALVTWLKSDEESLDGVLTLRLTQRNMSHIRYLLARMTAWLDAELGTGMSFADYADRSRKQPFEVEHIWANHFERHRDEFETKYDFEEHRNRFGDLLLLPKDFNASFGDMPYGEKVGHYSAQNSLARSLHPMAYSKNPNFLRLIEQYGLNFTPYAQEFTRKDIDERQALYRQLAGIVWDPARLGIA